jgi:hypothetical protein
MRKHQKLWPTYLESSPNEELDALIAPRCWDRFHRPGHHLKVGEVLPVRLADGSDAYGVVRHFVIRTRNHEWVGNEGAILIGTYADEATAIQVGREVMHEELRQRRPIYMQQVERYEPGTLWRWNAEIDAWVLHDKRLDDITTDE